MDPTVQVAVITGAFTLLTAIIGETLRRLTKIQHQVENSHSTNLRDDLDKVLVGVNDLREGQRRHSQELGDLRADMRVERQERVALSHRVDDERQERSALAVQVNEMARRLSTLPL